MDGPRVGVGVIVTRGEEILLVRRHGGLGAGSWSTPGGYLDHAETPEACAIREVQEETGVELADVRFRALTNDVFERERRHCITLWMAARCRSGDPSIRAAHEVSAVVWYRWDRLPAPLFLPLQNLLAGRCYPPVVGGWGA